MIGMGSFLTVPAVKAENIDAGRQKIQESIEQVQSQLISLQGQRAKVEEQIKNIEKAIEENTLKINETASGIKEAQAEIDDLNAEIKEIQARIDTRNEILKERAVSFQENGGKIAYIDVILGSSNFGDFINRVDAVSTIIAADTDLMEEHKKDQVEVKEKQQTVVSKLADLEEQLVELEGMRAQINEQKTQSEALKQKLVEQENASEEELNRLEDEDARLKAEALAQIQAAAREAASPAKETTSTVTKPATSQAESASASAAVKKSASTSESTRVVPAKSEQVQKTNTSSNTAGTGNLSTVIKAGYKYIGNSVYKFGGGRSAADIAAGRFDCSGFVSWAFKQGGYSVGSSTSALRNQGTRVSTSEMKPGDLVFFDTYKKDGHVGIYLGGGKFIGSQSSTGVAVANMSSGYWADHFAGHVRRIN